MLRATEELLAHRSFDEITVDEIVERAGYTKGAFYHRFGDKAALLRHMVTRLLQGADEAWASFLEPQRWADASLREVLEAFTRRLVTVYARATGLMRAYTLAARWGHDPVIRAASEGLNRQVLRGLTTLVRPRRAELRERFRDDPDEAVRLWFVALVATLQGTFLWSDPGLEPGANPDPLQLEARVLELLKPFLVGGLSRSDVALFTPPRSPSGPSPPRTMA